METCSRRRLLSQQKMLASTSVSLVSTSQEPSHPQSQSRVEATCRTLWEARGGSGGIWPLHKAVHANPSNWPGSKAKLILLCCDIDSFHDPGSCRHLPWRDAVKVSCVPMCLRCPRWNTKPAMMPTPTMMLMLCSDVGQLHLSKSICPLLDRGEGS